MGVAPNNGIRSSTSHRIGPIVTTQRTSRPAASSLLCTQWDLCSAPAITLIRITWSTRLLLFKGHTGPQSSPRRHQPTKNLLTCTDSLLWNHLLGMYDF